MQDSTTRHGAWALCLLFMVAMSAALFAQSGTAAAPKVTVIHAGRLLDVKTGKMLTNQAITIEGDKIAGIGPATATAPSGATVIDLPNATVLPGLIDAHTHVTYDPNFGYQELGVSLMKQAMTGVKNARTTLLAGFTTIRNVGADGYSDVALRDAIDAGWTPGPRILASGPALGITGGHCDSNLLPYDYHFKAEGVADGVAGVQAKVRETIKYGADVIKFCATGGVLSKGDNPQASQYTMEEMKTLIADAHRLGRKVAAHAHGAEGIRWASEAGVDSVEHGSYIDDAGIAALKKNGTYLVPQFFLSDWMVENAQRIGLPEMYLSKEREIRKIYDRNISKAIAAGVKIAYGTDAAVYPHGLNAKDFAYYVKAGMTPLQAIQTATVNDADLLGWSDKVGSIDAGKWADIIAVDGDPLKDVATLEHVKFVMKGGEVFKNEYQK
jgi:imidazolonepropionase-like amidohydrolase